MRVSWMGELDGLAEGVETDQLHFPHTLWKVDSAGDAGARISGYHGEWQIQRPDEIAPPSMSLNRELLAQRLLLLPLHIGAGGCRRLLRCGHWITIPKK